MHFWLLTSTPTVPQVQRGYAVLEELEDALKMSGGSRSALLQTLSSKFYQVRLF